MADVFRIIGEYMTDFVQVMDRGFRISGWWAYVVLMLYLAIGVFVGYLIWG